MKAIGYQKSLPIDAPNALMDIELPKPAASGKDILVRVEAVSVNPVDAKVRMRAAPEGDDYKVLGYDAAGVVESVGEDVTLFKAGDKVWYAGAINRSGSNAEYHLVDERIVSKMPESLSFTEAAALPLTSITAWELLFDRLGLTEESTGELLVIGASGGVGSIMVQLAKKLTNLTIIGTASRPETQEWVKNIGADHVIDHSKPLDSELKAIGFDTVKYIASLTNTDDHMAAIIEAIAPQGKMALIDDPTEFNIMPFKVKSVSVNWELMFTRSLFQTDDMIEQHKLLANVAKMVDAGDIKTTLASDFGAINTENLIKAHALLESGKSKGKIVLTGF
ncbi:zinc-binding alcohol dehydrogenase family protein [Leucothrix mucor]|uniref:zinc-binding alcohol dehydrogenase family protein n=1 Tax=Leucothrix mucor TaxID=45248 RepID=UPI0003B44947|nr:zinc-binding alcohol dehydrogenase family protein [Leucothrix mucor]